ncbi:MAG: carboxypeptidase regulatory-like domain-containing protein [Candidatus Cloacimonetes bacterium]|nr:carboxypeptidase regulatory-like domain-containing protein [Candidatus Cloacimonadota bacterium]
MLKSMIDLPKISGSRLGGPDWAGKKTFMVLSGLLFFSLIILITTIIPICLSAEITFERIYDSGSGRSVQQTTDEGYIIVGPLTKTDSLGNVLWTKPVGGKSVQQTTDGGYIIIGNIWVHDGRHSDITLTKTDSLGNTIWTRTYDAGWQEWGNSVKQTTDGGYILAGRYNTFGLIKTDSQGNIIWTNSYNHGYFAEANSVQQTTDGGYIAAGEVVIDNVDQQLYIVKTDSHGDTLWTTTSGSSNVAEIAFSVQQTSDGGYIAVGMKIEFQGPCYTYLVKTDQFGNILWTREHNFGSYCEARSIQQTTDGGYIYTGFTDSGESKGDVLLVRTDSQGNVLWSRLYGRTGFCDMAFSVQQTLDEGYIIGGFTGPNMWTSDHNYLIKTDSLGNFIPAFYAYVPEITYGALADTITIPVNTEEITSVGVFSVEFVLTGNSAVISGIDVDTSGTLLSGTDWSYEYNVVGDNFSVSMSGSEALAPHGTLINLQFVVVSDTVSGGLSSLHFESFLCNQGSPEAVTHDGVFIALGTGIEGTVTEADRGPIEGAVVTAFNDEFTYCDTTDAVGHYFMPEVVPDTYSMTVDVFGYNVVDTTGIVVVSGETTVVNFLMPHPEIAVVPITFDVTMYLDSTLDTLFYITNNGNGPLEFMIRTTDGSGGGVPGAIIESHPAVGAPGGFEWDGTYFWQANYTTGEVVKLDSNFNVIASYPGFGGRWIRGLAWHNGYLYQVHGNCIYKVDVQTGYELVDTILCPGSPKGIEWVDDHIWISHHYGQSWIYECDSLGNIINSWTPPGDPFGMSYNPYLDLIFLNVQYDVDSVYSINPHTGEFKSVFRNPGSHPGGGYISCTGSSFDSHYPEYIWIAHFEDGMIYLVDTGNEVVDWLSFEPVYGSVFPGETFPVNVRFDSHGLTPNSTYTASILIHNNSPDSLVNIPVTLIISEAEYGSLEGTVTDANTGNPIDSVMVTATSQDKYEYTTYTNTDGEYTINQMMIGSYDVTCLAGGYNDALEEDVVILIDDTTIVDFALLAPVMVVNPTSIDESISTDDTLTTYITVSNTGIGPLEYNITVYYGDEVIEGDAKVEFSVSPQCLSRKFGNNSAPIESNVSGWYSAANKPGNINNRLDEWYTYGNINSTRWVTWAAPERVTYFDPADFGLSYPFNITKINHWFYDHSSYPWDDATFHFKIYAEDGTTLLYESEDIEAEHMVEIVHELTIPVSITSAGFYFGIAPVSSSGFPSSRADDQYTGSNHSYYGSPGNWTLWSQSPDLGEFIQGVYLTSFIWMTVEPLYGTIEPGLVDTVTVKFNSTGIEPGTVLTADIVFTSYPDVGTETIPVTMHITGPGQQFSLGENWNWISFNVHPDDTSIESVFAPLTPDDIYQVMNQTQSATYYYPPGYWYGTLEEITDGEGYLVKMNNAVKPFMVIGAPIDYTTPINLNVDWNWIAYYPQYPLLIEDVWTDIVPNVFQVMNQTQSATYYDPPGEWYGSLEQMAPDIGYKVKMNIADTLIYSGQRASIPDNTIVTRDKTKDPPNWEVIQNTQCHMVLMAEITLEGEEFEGVDDNMAGAFCWIDSLECRGIAIWESGGAGFWYFDIVSNVNIGEEITFKIYDSETDTIYDCNETIIFEDGATVGTPFEPYQLTATLISTDGDYPVFSTKLNSNFPNPFNHSTTISFGLKEKGDVKLTVYNIKGQLIETLIDQEMNPGIYEIPWDVKNDNKELANGIYLYKFETKNKTLIKKMLFIR